MVDTTGSIDAADEARIRELSERSREMHSSGDDELTSCFSDDFSGFTRGGDALPLHEMEDRNTALEEEVLERTAELAAANDRLRATNEELARHVADLRQVEEARRLSEDKFAKAFHASPDAVLITRVSDGRVAEVNEGFVGLSGYDREAAIASSSLALDLWADPEGRLRCIAALQRDGSVRDIEFGFRIKSGEVIQCVYAGALIEVNAQPHILSVVRDVSDQRRAVAAVKRSADLLRGILDNLQDAYVRVDAGGRLVMVSPSAARMYGYSSTDEMIGLPTETLYADQAARQGIVDELRTSGQVVDRTGDGRRKDGSTFAVSLNAQVFRDEQGAVAGMEGFVRDITERRHAEEEIGRTREHYRAVVENVTDVIFIVDLEGTVTYVNPAMERLSGYTRDEVEGSPISRFVHPDDRLGLRRAFSETLSGVKTAHEFRVLERTGVVRWVATRSTVVAERGIPIGVTGVMTDFTERKHAEEELARLNTELEARAAALESANAVIARRAATDDLTGLANRRSFHESLVRTISLAQRHDSALALVSFDLDHFKQVNDTAGHEAGDLVLASFGALLASLCRAEDLPARLGGDEFSVLLPGTDEVGARGFAQRAIEGVRDCEPLNRFGVTISAGVAAWSLNELSDALLRRADDALYAAKRSGGDGLGESAVTRSMIATAASARRPRRVA